MPQKSQIHSSKMKFVAILCLLFLIVTYFIFGLDFDDSAKFDSSSSPISSKTLASTSKYYQLPNIKQCRAELKALAEQEAKMRPVFVNWTSMHLRPEVIKLGNDYGLTENMKFFMLVYESGLWGYAGSGSGSSLIESEKSVCLIAHLIRSLGVTLVLDLPSGDQTWAKHLRRMLPELKYVGVDLVPGVVQYSRDEFGHFLPEDGIAVNSSKNEVRNEFFLGDMAQDRSLITKIQKKSQLWNSEGEVVMLITRHIFFHLPYPNIFAFLKQVTVSPMIQYFLTTDGGEVKENVAFDKPFRAGGYRAVNMRKIPFPDEWSQVAPILTWVESDRMGSNWMQLYERSLMPDVRLYRNFQLTPLTFDCQQSTLIQFCSGGKNAKSCEVCANNSKES